MKTQSNYLIRLSVILSLMLFIVSCASVVSQYTKTREIDTIEAYEEFIKNYPDSEFVNEAKKRIEELEDFEVAKTKNTIDSYRAFINKYPESEYVKETEASIRQIYLSDKTINDLIKIFSDNNLNGTYTADKSPAPYKELGVFEGGNFTIAIAKFDDYEIVNISDIVNRTNIDVSIPTESRRYKSTSYKNMNPFLIICVVKNKSLNSKINKIFRSIGK